MRVQRTKSWLLVRTPGPGAITMGTKTAGHRPRLWTALWPLSAALKKLRSSYLSHPVPMEVRTGLDQIS